MPPHLRTVVTGLRSSDATVADQANRGSSFVTPATRRGCAVALQPTRSVTVTCVGRLLCCDYLCCSTRRASSGPRLHTLCTRTLRCGACTWRQRVRVGMCPHARGKNCVLTHCAVRRVRCCWANHMHRPLPYTGSAMHASVVSCAAVVRRCPRSGLQPLC